MKRGSIIPKWASVILSSFFWTVVFIITIICTSIGPILSKPAQLFGRKFFDDVMHVIAKIWGRVIIAAYPFSRVKITGIENIQKGQKYVLVANHQSMLDIMVALSAVPLPFKFMAKQELFNKPFLGWYLYGAKFIPVDRGSRESSRRALRLACQRLSEGSSVLFFPEGTRSLTGKVKPFKGGAFKSALETQTPILPITIDGTRDAIPKHSWLIRRVIRFRVDIGKPQLPSEFASPREAAVFFNQKIQARLAELRGEDA